MVTLTMSQDQINGQTRNAPLIRLQFYSTCRINLLKAQMLSLFNEIKRKSYYFSKATTFKDYRDGGLMEKAHTPVNAATHFDL